MIVLEVVQFLNNSIFLLFQFLKFILQIEELLLVCFEKAIDVDFLIEVEFGVEFSDFVCFLIVSRPLNLKVKNFWNFFDPLLYS